MPRKLPWVSPSSATRLPSSTSFRRTDVVDVDAVDSHLARSHVRVARTPSTSPPPTAPKVVFMREGYDFDDKWIMVEDEFYTTAKIFTQHIHHAEYVRFKQQAVMRGNQVLDSVTHLTDNKSVQSRETKSKLKLKAKMHSNSQKAAITELRVEAESSIESEQEEDEYMRDPLLAGLMTWSEVPSHDLMSITDLQRRNKTAIACSGIPRPNESSRSARLDIPGGMDDESSTENESTHLAHDTTDESESEDGDDLDQPRRKRTRLAQQTEEGTRLPLLQDKHVTSARSERGLRLPVLQRSIPRTSRRSEANERATSSMATSVYGINVGHTDLSRNAEVVADSEQIKSTPVETTENMARREEISVPNEREERCQRIDVGEVPTWLI